MLGGVDLRDAAVMPLEAEAVGRDEAIQIVQRGEVDRGLARGRQPLDVAAHHVGFIGGGRTVGVGVHARAQVLVPVLLVDDGRIGFGRRRAADQARATKRSTAQGRAAGEAALEESTPRGFLGQGRVR